MIEKTIRGGYDTWVEEAHESKKHPKDTALQLKAAAAYALLYMNNPAPKGSIVVDAKLRTRARGDSTGARDVTVERLAGKFDPKKTTWANMPGVVGGSTAVTAVTTLEDGDVIEHDVTAQLQTIAGGAPNRGWRIKTTAATAHKLYSLNAGKNAPVLVVKYTWRPDAPSNLTSSGGDVSVAKPVLAFDYNEASGTSDLAAIQVQIDPAGDAGSPDWDSGEVTTTVPELNLAATSYPGLADGASTQWRARAKSDDGYWSPWSDWVSFARTAKGVLAILSPGADPLDIVTESTPPFLWSFTDQVAYRVVITPAGDRTRFLHNTRKQPGADQSWTPPKKVITTPGARYSVGVRVWDSTPRVATTGDPTYVEAWQDFTFELDDTQDPASGILAVQIARTPGVELTAFRSTPPDSWTLLRGGEVIESDIDPGEALVATGQYRFRDWTAPAFTLHEYEAVPVVDGKAITGGPTATVKPRIDTLWVVDPINEWRFCLLDPQQNFHYGEDSEEQAKFDYVARKISSIRGLEGDASGVLVESIWDPRPLSEQLADVIAIKERPLHTYRVCVADLNFPAEVGKVDPAPSSEFLEGVEQRALAFSAWQNGELPFKAQA